VEIWICCGSYGGGEWEGRRHDWHVPACPPSSTTCGFAAMGGHLDAFLWGSEYGSCPAVSMYGSDDGSDDDDDFDPDFFGRSHRLVRAIGQGGNIDILKWFLEYHGGASATITTSLDSHPWIEEAAQYGHVNMLRWGLDSGIDVISRRGSEICKEAAVGNKLEVLKWALPNGYNWERRENSAGAVAAAGEDSEDSEDNDDTNDEWWEAGRDEWVFACAAAGKNTLEMMKWLLDAGCPWDVQTLQNAAACGRLENLKFAWENGCPRANLEGEEDWKCIITSAIDRKHSTFMCLSGLNRRDVP
jgi:hypothetical protein